MILISISFVANEVGYLSLCLFASADLLTARGVACRDGHFYLAFSGHYLVGCWSASLLPRAVGVGATVFSVVFDWSNVVIGNSTAVDFCPVCPFLVPHLGRSRLLIGFLTLPGSLLFLVAGFLSPALGCLGSAETPQSSTMCHSEALGPCRPASLHPSEPFHIFLKS